MASIGAVDLTDHLVLEGEFDYPAAAGSYRTTLGGQVVVQSDPLIAGRELKLSSHGSTNEFSGYFTYDQIVLLKDYERLQSQVTLTYEGRTFNVVIKIGGIDVKPVIERPDMQGDSWYTGSVTMIEV